MTILKGIKKYVLDTSSLLVLVRHLLRFDRDGKLLKIIEEIFSQEAAVLHAAVYGEFYRKVAADVLDFLHDVPRVPIHNLTPVRLQHVYNNWTNKKKKSTGRRLQAYSLKADCQIIEHCRLMNAERLSMEYVVVTEEVPYLKKKSSADPPTFKKIPDICASEGVPCMNLVDMLKEIDVRARFWQGRKSDKGDRSQR